MSATASSPTAKRKRAGPVSTAMGDVYVDTTPRKKRARFDVMASSNADDDNSGGGGSDDAASYAGSYTAYADSVNTVGSIHETETPATDASSTRSKSKPREKKFACSWPQCCKKYARPVQLQAHMNSHTGQRPFKCEEDGCDKDFVKREHLTRHIKDKHGDQSFTCIQLIYNDVKGKQVECGRTFSSQTKLKRHIAAHEDKEETTCSWEGCGKVFRKLDTLQRHIKVDHLGEDAYICTRKTADGHACGQSFPTPSQLKSHEKKEHESPKYICDVCVNTDPVPPSELIVNDLDDEFLPGPEDLVALDDEPDHSMMDTLSLNERAVPRPSPGPGRFHTLHELQRHNRLYHPPTCADCGKLCKSQKDLNAHMDIEHSGDSGTAKSHVQPKKFVCPHEGCVRSTLENGFAKKGNMQQHVKSTHSKEKKFVCGEYDLSGVGKLEGWTGMGCGRVMGTKQSLIGHIRTQHMGLPALVSKRTGLLEQDRTYRVPRSSVDTCAVDDPSEVGALDSDIKDDPASDKMLSMITGFGYDQLRPFVCLERARGCQGRFTKAHELAYHLEMTHDWNVDDINDAIDDPDTFAPDPEDNLLRQMLKKELQRPEETMVDPQLEVMQM
ncbi:Putative Zinc finger C2H2-type [Septoria linicola]|uniref:Zinc finger C2H2-type n=1 Tax=Septoria linicola TaxID=215465 RepID=A0A9Q9AEC4_9PEZI|nr:putative Zinc finger C2H2-type [Septoria linicola]USW47555.1 Putative Zinc finger C2H2-type [Septoria linicola]